MDDNAFFTRDFEIESLNRSLLFYQKKVGDVSCVVWDASLVLARYLEKKFENDRQYFKDKKILELGAGVGCVGITAACFGADVISTDLPEVLPLLDQNIKANSEAWGGNGGSVESRALRWGEDTIICEPRNIILLADCVYYSESVGPLIKTLCEVSDRTTEVIICQEERETDKQRAVWKEFRSKLSESFNVKKIPQNEQHPLFSCPDITLLQASRL